MHLTEHAGGDDVETAGQPTKRVPYTRDLHLNSNRLSMKDCDNTCKQLNAMRGPGPKKNLGKQSALADKTPIGLTDACMHTDTMTDMMPVNCNVRHRRGFCQCCYIFSGRMQKEPLCTIQPQTAIGTDTLNRNKVHPKSLKTGHDILLARRQSRHDPRCPTEIHPPYLQQQETRLPQHTENATCHCAVQSTHSQPEPEPA